MPKSEPKSEACSVDVALAESGKSVSLLIKGQERQKPIEIEMTVEQARKLSGMITKAAAKADANCDPWKGLTPI